MNRELELCLQRQKTIRAMFGLARERALGNVHNKYVSRLECPHFGGKVVKEDFEEYFDEVFGAIEDGWIVSVVVVFEKVAFKWLSGATGELRKLIKEGYPSSDAFGRSTDNLVKRREDIGNLHGLQKVIDRVLDAEEKKRLSRIVDFRNYVAHGKRWPRPEGESLDMSSTAAFLDDVLQEIKPAR